MILTKTQKIFLQGKRLLLLIPAVLFLITSAFSQSTTCSSDFDFKIDHNTKKVVFEAKSSHTPAVFAYDLGDGSFERGQRIVHTYSAAGSYKVTLTTIAFNSSTNQRCTTKVSKKIEIVDCDRLKIAFKYEVEGLTVKLKGETNSNNVSTGFKFGDGSGERKDEVKHTYAKPGIYEVCYIAEDLTYGCRKEECKKIIISAPCDLEAKFEYRQEDADFKFIAKASDSPARFLWDFGDGNKAKGDEVKHSYDKPGDYKVCLTVYALNATNDQICTTRVCKKVTVEDDNDCGLRAKFEYRQDDNQFKFLAKANQSPARFLWNYGDGNTGSGDEVKHEYDKPGTYLVCLTVLTKNATTNQVCSTKVCKRVVVEKPECQLKGNYDYKTEGLGLVAEAESNERNVHYFWSFGDGTDATGKDVKHRYKKPGVYEVCLIVFNPRTKCKVCICKKVVVEKPCGLKADFKKFVDEDLLYVKARTNASRGSSYHWNFGDGSTANGRQEIHQYSKKGVYTVTLTVKDRRRGCKVEVSKRVVIGLNQLTPVALATAPIATDGAEEITNIEEEQPTWEAKISPSPARSTVAISSEDKDLTNVKIFGMDGALAIEDNTNLSDIDVSALKKGFYYAHVTAIDGTTTIVKFLKN